MKTNKKPTFWFFPTKEKNELPYQSLIKKIWNILSINIKTQIAYMQIVNLYIYRKKAELLLQY